MSPCPACGLPSLASEIRCPRCNALKISGGCTGACSMCRTKCAAVRSEAVPSDEVDRLKPHRG